MTKRPVTTWELGGLSLLAGTPTRPVYVPSEIALEGQWLASRALQPGDRAVHLPDDMLFRFVQIETPAQVLRFAKQYGVLWLHGERDGARWREPVAFWLQCSRRARAILNVASAVHREEVTSVDDWSVIYEAADRSQLTWIDEGRTPPKESACFLLSLVVTEWLDVFHAVPILEWWDGHPRVAFHRDLPGALAVGLLMAVTRSEGVAICSACGRPYLRTGRQPKRGQNNYCSDCGTQAAWRSAARKRRAKIAEDHQDVSLSDPDPSPPSPRIRTRIDRLSLGDR